LKLLQQLPLFVELFLLHLKLLLLGVDDTLQLIDLLAERGHHRKNRN
jgi:hypothetical protein